MHRVPDGVAGIRQTGGGASFTGIIRRQPIKSAATPLPGQADQSVNTLENDMTEQKIVPFLFEGEHTIRVVPQIDSKLWVIGKDVATALGYKDTAKAISTHCKHGRPIGEGVGGSPTPYGIDPQTKIIPEGDVYRLVLRSGLPAADRFERWLMDEILPALRQGDRIDVPRSTSEIEDDELHTPDGLKLRKVNTATRVFGERAGAQLWAKLGLEMVPAMRPVLAQFDMLEIERITVTSRVSGAG